tara:strand:- start:839 stop:1024 length:186 start_codon:yes stop_codon:yes gene_type:complete
MEFSRNTSTGKSKTFLMFLIKITLIFISIFVAVMLLNKIDYPSPNKEIEKIIPNENLKIVK